MSSHVYSTRISRIMTETMKEAVVFMGLKLKQSPSVNMKGTKCIHDLTIHRSTVLKKLGWNVFLKILRPKFKVSWRIEFYENVNQREESQKVKSSVADPGMFIPDPDFYPSWFPDPRSRILDPKTATKERGEEKKLSYIFWSHKCHKIENYFNFEMLKKIFLACFQKFNLSLSSPRSALQRQNTEISKQIFPEKEYRTQSQFPHSCVCERFIYSHHRSAYSAGGNM
jgi:hypothetical protein